MTNSFTPALTTGGAPDPILSAGGNQEAAIWTGNITIPATAGGGGTSPVPITFITGSDDGSALYIDGDLVVNNLNDQGTTYRSGGFAAQGLPAGSGIVMLVPGSTHTITIEYYNGGGGANLQVLWDLTGATSATYSSGTAAGTIIPISAFSIIPPSIGNVVKNGSGTVTLAGTNTYTGTTTINGGTLQVSSDANLGVSTGSVTLNGGTLEVTTSFTTNRTITVGANNGTIQVDAVGATPQTLTVATGIISSGGNLTKSGPGNLLLLGNGLAGNGTVTMAGGTLSLNGAGSTIANPLALQSAGFNQDMVWSTSEANSQVGTTTAFDGNGSGTGNVFYEAGVPFTPGGGLPNAAATNRTFVSQANSSAIFQLQPYTANNVLYAPDTSNYTLTLSNPGSFQKLALLDSAANGAATFTVTLNYTDGSSTPFTGQIAPDWFSSGGALTGVGRITRATAGLAYSGLPSNPSLFEDDLTLSAADQAKTLASITITRQSGGQLGVFAVSGLLTTPPAAYNYNVVVTANATINLATANPNATVTLGNLAIGTNTLTVTGTSGRQPEPGRASPCRATRPIAPAANVTLNLGALNDGGSRRYHHSQRRRHPGQHRGRHHVTAGTTVNVTGGTLNLTVPGALSTATAAALVNVASGQTVNLGASRNPRRADRHGHRQPQRQHADHRHHRRQPDLLRRHAPGRQRLPAA